MTDFKGSVEFLTVPCLNCSKTEKTIASKEQEATLLGGDCETTKFLEIDKNVLDV
jgi:hypothetical protein